MFFEFVLKIKLGDVFFLKSLSLCQWVKERKLKPCTACQPTDLLLPHVNPSRKIKWPGSQLSLRGPIKKQWQAL